MKKILLLFIIISNVFVFFNVYNVYQEKVVSDSYDLFGYENNKYYDTVIFNDKLINVDGNEFVQFLNQVIEKHPVLIYTSDSVYAEGWLNYYIGYNQSLKKAFQLNTSTDLIFNSHEERYYTNQNKTNAVNFHTLNSNFIINLFPLEKLLDEKNKYINEYTIIAEDEETLTYVKNLIKNKYSHQFQEFIQYENHVLNVDEKLNKDMLLPMIFCIVISVTILLIYVEKSASKIAIMKLNGVGVFSIFYYIFLPIGVIIFLGTMSTLAICYMLVTQTMFRLYFDFFFDLMKWGFIESLILLLLLTIYFVIIMVSSYIHLLKNKNNTKYFLNFNYVMKIICLIAVLPLLNTNLNNFNMTVKSLKSCNEIKKLDKPMQYIEGFLDGYKNDGYDISKYYQKDFDEYYEIYQNEYERLNQKGLLCFLEDTFVVDELSFPCYLINQNYFNRFPIRDANNQLINLSSYSRNIIFGIPSKYKDLHFEQLKNFENNSYEICYISENQDFLNLSLFTNSKVDKLPPCFLIYTDQATRINKSPFFEMFYEGDINELLSPHFKDKVKIMNSDERINHIISMNENDLIENLKIILLISLLLLLMTVEYCYLYFKTNSYKLSVKKLHGFSHFRLYGDIYLENIFIFVLLFFIAYFYHIEALSILPLFLYDMFVVFVNISIFEKKNVNAMLKGSEM